MMIIPWPINKLIDLLLQRTNKATTICASLGIFLLLTSQHWTAWIPNCFLEPKIKTIILLLMTTIIILIVIISCNVTPNKKQVDKPKTKNNLPQSKLGQLTGKIPLTSGKILTKYLNVNWDENGDIFCLKCNNTLIPNMTVGFEEKANKSNFKCSKCNEQYLLRTDSGELLTKDSAKSLWIAFDKDKKIKQFEALSILAKANLK